MGRSAVGVLRVYGQQVVRTGSAAGHGCSLHDRPHLKVREPQLKQCLLCGEGQAETEATVDQLRLEGL